MDNPNYYSDIEDNFDSLIRSTKFMTKHDFDCPPEQMTLAWRLTKQILLLFGQTLHLDYFDDKLDISSIDHLILVTTTTTSTLNHLDYRQEEKLESCKFFRFVTKFTRLQSFLVFVSFIWMMLNLYYQYRYDANYFRLEQFKASAGNLSSILSAAYYSAQVERSHSQLRRVGAPFESAHFAVQVAYVYVLVIIVTTYFQGAVQYNMALPFNFPLARLILDARRECALISRLIVRELVGFHNSSRNFIKASYFAKYICNHGFEEFDSIEQVNELSRHNQQVLAELYEMATSGYLQPLGWTCPFVHKLARYYGLFVVSSVVYILMSQLVLAIYLFSISINYDIKFEPVDVVFSVVVTMMVIMATCAVIYYASFVLFHSLMQINYINSIIELIDRLVYWNELRLIGLLDLLRLEMMLRPDPLRANMIDSTRKQMNSDLLYAFVHFKTFVSQFNHSKEACSIVLSTATGLFFLMPTIARLHLPYISSSTLKLTAVMVSLATTVVFNSVTLPVCYLHSRSLKLYKSLNSLMAHTIETTDGTRGGQEQPAAPTATLTVDTANKHTSNIYNKHLVWLLRKELNSGVLTTQFAIEKYGLIYTYPNVVRIHFYFGLIVLSIISTVGVNNEAFYGQFLSDPFRLL